LSSLVIISAISLVAEKRGRSQIHGARDWRLAIADVTKQYGVSGFRRRQLLSFWGAPWERGETRVSPGKCEGKHPVQKYFSQRVKSHQMS
jgi:hypothetical protein